MTAITFGLTVIKSNLPVGQRVVFRAVPVYETHETTFGWQECGYAAAQFRSGGYIFEGRWESTIEEGGIFFRDLGFKVLVRVTRENDGKDMGYLDGLEWMAAE